MKTIIWMRKSVENHCCIPSLRGTVRESSGPSIPSCTGAGPKREQNLIHSEPKAVPDRFTFYSRFGEIYNGKHCYRTLQRTYLLDLEDSHVRPFFLLYSIHRRRKRVALEKNKLNHIVRLPWIFKDNFRFAQHKSFFLSLDTKQYGQGQEILNYS